MRSGIMRSVVALLVVLTVIPVHGQKKPPVEADYQTLRTVILMSIDDSIYRSTDMGSSIHPIFNKRLAPGTIREHRALVDLFKNSGVRVLEVRDLLQDAVENARRKGALEGWIQESFPGQYEAIAPETRSIGADAILQRSDEFFYRRNAEGNFDPLFYPITSMYWSRDFAISTPKGIIIGNGQNYGRSLENAIARLLFGYASELQDYPVVFDAAKEGVYLDGGDVIVKDEKTLFVGVGQRSDREAAPLLARKLGMDVIAVNMPPKDKPNGMSRLLLHLDSIFNLVDKDKAVAVPYFLEKEYVGSNPMIRILSGIARQTDAIVAAQGEARRGGDSKQIRLTLDVMPEVGWVTKYDAETGKETPLDMKLVDYVRSLGYKGVFAGGERGDLPEEKYALERAMYELRWQGVNVAQLGPGRIIAYEHNVHTNSALAKAGVEVLTFPGELLSFRNGGPHCLIMPLVRRAKD